MPALKKHLPTLCLSLGLAATAWQATAAEKVVATDLEPLHHVILQNKYVTVMRVLIQPGQSTQYHEQHLDYVNTHIDGSPVKIEFPDKPATLYEMKSGNVKFGAHQGKSDADKVTNTGTTVNHQVAFEINMTGPQHFGGATRPDTSAIVQVLDKPTVKGWKVTLKPGESTGEYTQHGPGVRVFFSEGRVLLADPAHPNHVKEIWVHKGDAFLTEPGKVDITDGSNEPLTFNDYELL
ncbi:hypothetical protein [Candidatus Pantoea multigeneris]|uniref:Uncharacterized protein n=1 Tax=Candidatus Pantoea multigeneris TaxID=2608357 RepID=A0ABX0R3P6_9GAMM|nr:hypothetical protein [Pantoea multigeneris]NIF20026.1 hypothetical protein [Pantoea multigeneris]